MPLVADGRMCWDEKFVDPLLIVGLVGRADRMLAVIGEYQK